MECLFLTVLKHAHSPRKNELDIQVFRSIDQVELSLWESVVNHRNIYLGFDYLKALESSMKDEIAFFYALIFKQNRPVQVAVFQLVQFKYKGNGHSKLFLNSLCHSHSEKEGFNIPLLVGGNVFANGENVSLWTDEVSDFEAMQAVFEVVDKIKNIDGVVEQISVQLFKEFWPDTAEKIEEAGTYGYKPFEIDVNMVLNVSDRWQDFDDYLADMKTKFRTKAKGVFKKSSQLVVRSLSIEEIDLYQARIQTLFKNVLDRSPFGLGAIEPLTFGAFKKFLGPLFDLRGAFHEDVLVGFSTAFYNGKTLEANYVGLDYDYNYDHAIYQRLLYDFVERGIRNKMKQISFGRTSETIKSSIGAKPVAMTLYAKHKSKVKNLILSTALNFVQPRSFELRPPFKTFAK